MESPKNKFIFIGGIPRSGTSLIQKILNNHPDIFGGPEFDHLPALMKVMYQMEKGIINYRQSDFYNNKQLYKSFKELIVSLLIKPTQKRNKPIVSEKTPGNVLVFQHLVKIFPKAKYILIVRDPRAIINSLIQVNKRAIAENEKIGHGNNFLVDLKMITSYLRSGDLFVNQFPSNSHVIYYEELVTDPHKTVKGLCDFVEVKFIPVMLNTQNSTEFSKRIEDDGVWYTPEMFDRRISSDGMNSWKTNLVKVDKLIIEDTFTRYPLEILTPYHFATRVPKVVRYWNFLRHADRKQVINKLF